MCDSCGDFITAVRDGDDLIPTEDACPGCEGTRFKDNESGQVVDTAS